MSESLTTLTSIGSARVLAYVTEMDLDHVTFAGPAIDDTATFDAVSPDLQSLLRKINGFVQFGGGFHVRGACKMPSWHGLHAAWRGEGAFHNRYASIDANWVPFAEDCVGDQFFDTPDGVVQLLAETGEIVRRDHDLLGFIAAVQADPADVLAMQPLKQVQKERGDMAPGHLILAYPPFCTVQAKKGVALKPVPAADVHAFHADLADRMPNANRSFAALKAFQPQL